MRSPQENPKAKVRRKLPLHSTFVFGLLMSVLPASSSLADVIELSQSQLRHLVSEQQIQGAETVVGAAVQTFGGTPLDIRGFLSDGRMTYRILIQRNDGSVIEVLMNGQTAQHVSHTSDMGQAVAAKARTQSTASDTVTLVNGTTMASEPSNQSSGSNASSTSAPYSSSTSSSSNSSSNSNSASNASSNSNSGGNSANASNGNNRDNDNNNRGNKKNRGNGNND